MFIHPTCQNYSARTVLGALPSCFPNGPQHTSGAHAGTVPVFAFLDLGANRMTSPEELTDAFC